MKRLVLLLLVLSACLHRGPEDQPDPSEDEIPTDPYLITLLIHNRSGYMISAGGAGRVFGNVLPGEQKCVRLPNNDVQQQLWYRVMATESEQYTLPFYPRESSGEVDHRRDRVTRACCGASQCSRSRTLEPVPLRVYRSAP